MSSFHNDIFNRRSSGSFFGEFSQGGKPGVFAPAAMPRPLFAEDYGHRRSSFSGHEQSHTHFAYVAGCEICEETIQRGHQLCYHEHRVVCKGVHHGCCCHHCCHSRESLDTTTTHNEGYSARTEESVTDSQFANGRVRARSATTTVGDASFGFANVDAEMRQFAADNRWRTKEYDSFYGRPMCDRNVAPPPEHMRLREGNVGGAFEAHGRLHHDRQSHMHADAAAYFNGHHHHMDAGYYGRQQEEEEEEVKVTTTTTTTTKTTVREIEDDMKSCHKVQPPPPEPVIVVPAPPPEHHHHHHHSEGTVIPVGTKPDAMVVPPEPCCTWCKFLPCLECPKPTNPNARFNKANFRLYPEYEFLPDHLEVPKPSEYFPDHTHVATRSQYKITIPGARDIAQKIYVDFIGDQLVVIGEHGKPLLMRHHHHGVSNQSTPTMRSTRSSLNSKEKAHMHHFVPGAEAVPGVSRVFAKNFFLPRDTYDRDRAQVFVKPNGKLKIVVPVIDQ
ncbi:hypothetical protein GQ54DRAFT_341795 [Martensiomyces pterosporus]|nr:hypothetical protein GQ54DRAFT_341795 [Martensiomyces pterosporus]